MAEIPCVPPEGGPGADAGHARDLAWEHLSVALEKLQQVAVRGRSWTHRLGCRLRDPAPHKWQETEF